MGRSYATAFAKRGAKLALNDFDPKGLAATVALVKNLGAVAIHSEAFDVSDRTAMQAFAEDVKARLGNAHVVINNAGVGGASKPVWSTDEAAFDRTMQINFHGVVNGTRAFLPQLLANDQGAVVNVSSIFGLVGVPSGADYSASKFAVRGFTEALMVELVGSRISVHLVHPGGINTAIGGGSEFNAKFLKTSPDAVAERVIRAIRSGKQRIVYGHQSFPVWVLSWALPLETRNRILFRKLSNMLPSEDYAQISRQPRRPRRVLVKLAVAVAALLTVMMLGTLHPKAGAFVYDGAIAMEADAQGLKESFVDLGELRMATLQRGSTDAKDALLLVHGYTADKSVWVRFAKAFGSQARVVIPDLAGHGASGFNATWDFSPGAQAVRLLKLIDQLGIEKVTIIGNSMGGAIAAQFAADYPLRTNAVVLIDAAGLKSPHPSESDLAFARGESPFEIDTQEQFEHFYGMTMAKPPYVPGFVLREIGHRYRTHKPEYARIKNDLRPDSMVGRVGAITAPTLVIWGRRDRIIDVSAAELWKAELPNGEIQIVDDLGHMPMVEAPEDTATRVREFLVRTGTSKLALN